jgi:hypothetical protein
MPKGTALGKTRRRWKKYIKIYFTKTRRGLASYCEHVNEFLDFTTGTKFLHWMNDYLIMKDSIEIVSLDN